MRFALANAPGNTGATETAAVSSQPLDALEKHLDSLEDEHGEGRHEIRSKARQALQCLLQGNQRFCQVRDAFLCYH